MTKTKKSKLVSKPMAKIAAKKPVAKPTVKVAAKAAAKPAVKAKAAKPVVVAKVAEKPAIKAPVKAIENSKVALKKESVSKETPVIPAVKAPKPAKVPRVSAAALARAEKATDAANQLSAKWSSLYKKAESIEAKPYSMKSVYEEKTAILHKILGWGYILANKNDRLEVLFKDGIKYLISNYKSA
jgi:hypothetical protein